MSSVLFTTCPQDIFRRLNREETGIKIYGVYLSSLKFADHIFLFADKLETLHKTIEELQKENAQVEDSGDQIPKEPAAKRRGKALDPAGIHRKSSEYESTIPTGKFPDFFR